MNEFKITRDMRLIDGSENVNSYNLRELEKETVLRALKEIKKIPDVAKALGINPVTLWRKRKQYGLI